MTDPHAHLWPIRPGVTYLNHGSFGFAPRAVCEARRAWQAELEAEPMDFFVRQLEGLLAETRVRLGRFVGAPAGDLALVENATAAMNVVVASTPLSAGDEVLLTDHEYGAVARMWRRACDSAGASLVIAELPLPIARAEDVVEALFARVTPRTRMLVVSHVTSPTAIVLPIEALCGEARRRGLRIAVDGPHAPAMQPLDISRLDPDYYCASCHKWLCAPVGTGFLYVNPRRAADVRPTTLSWGRLEPALPTHWSDEFLWTGTRDPSGYLAISAAIDFIESLGASAYREETHALAVYARQRLEALTGREAFLPDSLEWYGAMIAVPLPPGPGRPLQDALWQRFAIEVPIVEWGGRRLVRVSCCLYNDRQQIDHLVDGLVRLLAEER